MYYQKNWTEEEKSRLIERAKQAGFHYESTYGNCSQCSFAAIDDTFDLGVDNVFKGLYALGGGCGQMTFGTCGALTTANLVIGLVHGRDRDKMAEPVSPVCFELTRELCERFMEAFGAMTCCGVQEHLFGQAFDFSDEMGREGYAAAGGHEKCAGVVSFAAGVIAEFITRGDL